jgi:sugar lactone lactonase YvrE
LSGYGISPDGSVVAVSQREAFDNKIAGVALIDSRSGKMIHLLPDKYPGCLSFHPDGRLFVADEEQLRIFEPVAWKQTDEIAEVNAYEIAISPDGKLLAVTTCPGVRVWRLGLRGVDEGYSL